MKRFCEKQFWYPLCAAKGKQNGILVLYGRWWWNWKIWPRQDTERGVNVGWLPLTWHDNNFDLTIRPLLISEYPSQLPTTPYPDPSACLFVLVLGWWRADREDGMSADRQGCVVHRYTRSLAHSRNALGSNAMAEQREIFMRWPTWPTRTPLPFPMQPPAVLESQKFRIQIQFEIKARPRKKFPEGVEPPNCKRSHCCLWWKMSKITLPASVHWKNSYIFKDIPDYNSWLNTDINQLTYNKNMLEK